MKKLTVILAGLLFVVTSCTKEGEELLPLPVGIDIQGYWRISAMGSWEFPSGPYFIAFQDGRVWYKTPFQEDRGEYHVTGDQVAISCWSTFRIVSIEGWPDFLILYNEEVKIDLQKIR